MIIDQAHYSVNMHLVNNKIQYASVYALSDKTTQIAIKILSK